MAKVTALSAITALTTDDLLMAVDAPGTSPVSKKITFDNVQKSISYIPTPLTFKAGTATDAKLLIDNGAAVANLMFGNEAAYALTSGTGNLAIGLHALKDLTTGINNTAIGWDSQMANIAGSNNVSVGEDALKLVTGDANTALGESAGYSTTSGTKNVAIGPNALYDNLTGNYNVAIGYSAMKKVLSNSNIGIGDSALYNTTTGNDNTVVGVSAGYTNVTGANNVLMGTQAGSHLTSSNNTIIGQSALTNLTSGANNTALGTSAGQLITGGTANATPANSVFIGYDTRAAADGQTNQIVIGHGAIGGGSNSVTLGNASITKTVLRGDIVTSTADGSDNSVINVCGGGAANSSRGGFIGVYGNEHANAGDVTITTGDATGSAIQLKAMAATNGVIHMFSGGQPRWQLQDNGILDQDGTTGGNIRFNTAGTGLTMMYSAISATGTNLATATLIANRVQFVDGADGVKGIKFPTTPTAGDLYIIYNRANAALLLYPGEAGDQINTLGVGVAASLAAYAGAIAVANNAGQWWVMEGAAA